MRHYQMVNVAKHALNSKDEYWSRRGTSCSHSDEFINHESVKIREGINTIINDLVKGFINAAQIIPGFSTLPYTDKANLFKVNLFETWMCFHHLCFSKELEVVCTEKFNAHKSHISDFLGERSANLMWLFSEQLKQLHLSRTEIPVVWAITLLNPDRQVYEHSIKIMKLRDKMVMCFDYLCRRNQLGTWKKKIHGVLATVRELHAASKDFNNVL